MTAGLYPPELSRQLTSLNRRVTDLERRLDAKPPPRPIPPAVFSLPGELVSGLMSGPWPVVGGARLITVVFALHTPGTTATVVELVKRDPAFPAFTSHVLQAGVPILTVEVDQQFPHLDLLFASCPTAGSGAVGLTVVGVFDR